KPANDKGYSASAALRFFGYKAGYEDVVNFFDIGTRVSNLLLREPTLPQSGQTSARSITGSGTNGESDQVKPWPAQRAKPQPAGAARVQPVEAASKTIVHGQSSGWPKGVRILGLAAAIIAAITLFKLFGTGRGPQTQFSNQTPTTSSKVDSASERQTSDNGRSIGLSAGPGATADSNSERGSALVPDAIKTSPPADNGPKLAAGSEQ